MEDKTCIVSVAFRNPYIPHSHKQEEFLISEGFEISPWYKNPAQPIGVPDKNHFMLFRDRLPARYVIYEENIITHFQESLYGFKPHAINQAIRAGYNKVIWLDPSVLPTVPIQVLIDSLDEHPMIVRIGDAPITKMCNQKAKDWFDITEEEMEGHKHVGGTIYGFNFNHAIVRDTFELWKEAEENGIFGNQDEFMAGHWADEACMVLSMITTGVPQYWEEKFTYYNMKNGI